MLLSSGEGVGFFVIFFYENGIGFLFSFYGCLYFCFMNQEVKNKSLGFGDSFKLWKVKQLQGIKLFFFVKSFKYQFFLKLFYQVYVILS